MKKKKNRKIATQREVQRRKKKGSFVFAATKPKNRAVELDHIGKYKQTNSNSNQPTFPYFVSNILNLDLNAVSYDSMHMQILFVHSSALDVVAQPSMFYWNCSRNAGSQKLEACIYCVNIKWSYTLLGSEVKKQSSRETLLYFVTFESEYRTSLIFFMCCK